MSALIRFIKKLSPCRRREDIGDQVDEQEQQDQVDEQEKHEQVDDASHQEQASDVNHQEQAKDEGHQEEKSQMLLTLRDLQRTMDPLIAAQVYNNHHNPLCRLPEELLLHILHCLNGDVVSLHCLRRVSRIFRRLINEPDIWKHMSLPLSARFTFYSEEPWHLPTDAWMQLKQYLRQDQTCDRCKLHCTAERSASRNYYCDFSPLTGTDYTLYCHACSSHHDVLAFSLSNQDQDKRERRCLGRQGAVRLCEHIRIPWATIEAHINRWQQHSPGDWQACLDDFSIECHHPSHDTRCTAEEPQTWPRARLETDQDDQNSVLLILEWKPHSGLDAFTLVPDGLAPVSELRTLFQKYRKGPASILVPSYPAIPLPELLCFAPTQCDCLHYETGIGKRSIVACPWYNPRFFRDKKRPLCSSGHRYFRYESGQKIRMAKHWPRGECNPVCLVTIYQQEILVCRKTDGDKINPTHMWFHAMDPATYPRPTSLHDSPLCEEMSCMNYYRRLKSIDCRVTTV
ncbi:hypothetical protein F4776DRAFT_623863 [Hypoxylon sp. NC0597]|nr:hypothetical protein F4776DRAFT_623863 [Hypoxylon sp. NC0597]